MRVVGLRALFQAIRSLVPALERRMGALRSSAAGSIGGRQGKRRRSLRQRGARFEQLERREVFNATFHGGALLPHPEVQGVYLGSDWRDVTTEATFKTSLDSYLSYLVQSPFMDNMTDHSYNVGQGTASAGVVLPLTLSKSSAATGGVSDANIQTDLQTAITAKTIGQPTQNKIYVVFVEQGVVVHDGADTSATTFLGYHSAFLGHDASNVPFDIHYAVIAYPNDTAVTGFNPTASSQGFGNEFQLLSLGGTSGGSIKPTFGAATATVAITRTDEVQTLTLGGTEGGTIRLGFQGPSDKTALAGSDITQLTISAATPPTAAQVQDHLNSIAALNGNVQVAGNDGGPFTITFRNGLTGVNVNQLVAVVSGGATATIATQTGGSMPTAAQVLASLNSVTGLTNNVAVAGSDGGPFTIEMRLGNVSQIGVTPVSGGLTGAVTTLADGRDTISGDFDQLTFTSSHEIAEAASDPDANYKTAGWYDAANGNIEIADLTLDSSAQFFGGGTRLNGYLTTNIFDQNVKVVGSETTSTAFPLHIASDNVTITSALQGVTATQLSLSRVQVSWTPVPGAVGYRVFLVNGNTSTLLSRVQGTINGVDQTSTILTGLPQLQNLTFRVEAYNAVYVTDAVQISMTLPLSGVTAPQHLVAKQNPAANSSAILSWDASPGAAGYRIYLFVNGRKTLMATVGEGVTTSTINGLATGTKLSFQVEAFRGSKFADSAVASVTLTKPSLAAPVVSIQAVNGNNSVAQLSWNAVSGTKGYRVYYVNSKGVKVLLSTLGSSTLTTKISGLPAHTSFIVEAFSGLLVADSKAVHL